MLRRFINLAGTVALKPFRLSAYRFSQQPLKPTQPQPQQPSKSQNQPPLNQKDPKLLDQQEEKEEEKDASSTAYILGGGALIIAMSYVLMQMQTLRGENKSTNFKQTKVEGVGKADIGGEWDLLDTKGRKVSSKDFRGQYYLIYFGFCNCPDICPNSLTKLRKALEQIRKLPESEFFKLRSIFVSVDPDRDTPQKIDKFLSFFDKQMIGLTGTYNNDPALKDCLKKFKIYATKIQFEDQQQHQGRKSYTIDHTILTYLMSDENEYMTHLGANLGQHQLSKAIVDAIMAREREKLKKLKA